MGSSPGGSSCTMTRMLLHVCMSHARVLRPWKPQGAVRSGDSAVRAPAAAAPWRQPGAVARRSRVGAPPRRRCRATVLARLLALSPDAVAVAGPLK